LFQFQENNRISVLAYVYVLNWALLNKVFLNVIANLPLFHDLPEYVIWTFQISSRV
jgi:hypothetical protein